MSGNVLDLIFISLNKEKHHFCGICMSIRMLKETMVVLEYLFVLVRRWWWNRTGGKVVWDGCDSGLVRTW